MRHYHVTRAPYQGEGKELQYGTVATRPREAIDLAVRAWYGQGKVAKATRDTSDERIYLIVDHQGRYLEGPFFITATREAQ